jgi:methionyl-tRNA formyltransferase
VKVVVFAYSNVGDRCLRVLHARGIDVALVITHRDDAREKIWFERVADTAAELGMTYIYADNPAEPVVAEAVRQARPDVIFSFYYRSMIPTSILNLAPLGAFNMHGSMLPKYRGRAPTNWAVLHGETETGATLHAMVAQADGGDIIDQSAVPILPDDTGRQVFDKVTVAAEQVLWRSLQSILEGHPAKRRNDVANGSYFPGRRPEDGRIDWSQPASAVYNLIRAVAPPYPGAFVELHGKRLIIGGARRARPGSYDAKGLKLGLNAVTDRTLGLCGDGCAIEVQQLLLESTVIDTPSLQRLLSAESLTNKSP